METKQKNTSSANDPAWIIELAKKQIPQHADIILALNNCVTCRWESAAYAYFNEGLKFQGSVMLNDPIKGLIVIDLTTCGKVAGIEFVKEITMLG